MNLAIFRANEDFSQSMLEQARESERESIRTTSMCEPVLATADGRVAQEPSLRKILSLASPPQAGKIDLSEKNDRFIDSY